MTTLDVTEAYPADRAAALAGVPRSTLHYWASNDIWIPSVSPERVRLWSLSDIAMLRFIYWLRRGDKTVGPTDVPVQRTKMAHVRQVVNEVLHQQEAGGSLRICVDRAGTVVVRRTDGLEELSGQRRVEPELDLLSEYRVDAKQGMIGPDLIRPRPLLRIIPGKLAGEPHVKDTRVTTTRLDALLERGYRAQEIIEMYPFLSSEAIAEARQLEEQLRRNLHREAA